MKTFRWMLTFFQIWLAVRVYARMMRSARGERIELTISRPTANPRVAVIVPVLDEIERVGPCLKSLCAQTYSPEKIIVVDGGSTDGTLLLLQRSTRDDPRVCLVDASPVPEEINGKAFGLQRGLEHVRAEMDFVLTIDADVRLHPDALASMLEFARQSGVRAFSIATSQRVAGRGIAIVHPSMLTTLVYRFGIPGRATTRIHEVQANGQCFLVERAVLNRIGGFTTVQSSICEDVTLARSIAASGVAVGFYEGEALVETEMYADAVDAWRNWPRSLPMRDRYSSLQYLLGLMECVFVQATPLWMLILSLIARRRRSAFAKIQAGLLLGRLGVLFGTARAYPNRPWTYWISPIADLPVTLEILRRSRQRTHSWRGRTITTGGKS
jgi:dolichol-phosphate mannosyltransferase